MSNLNDFSIHSQYPVEKIIWTAEGRNDSTNPNWQQFVGYGYVFEFLPDTINWQNVLVDGVWTNDGWATQYPIESNSKPTGYQDYGGSYGINFDWVGSWVLAKDTTLDTFTTPHPSIVITGNQSENQKVIEYRFWAYLIESDWASNTTEKTAETLSHSLQKNTNLAQLNMISENMVSVPDTQTRTIYHNLGFRPLCKIWCKRGNLNSWSKNLNTITHSDPFSLIQNKITIDNEKITIYAEDGSEHLTQDFLVRIYNYDISV